MAVKSDRLKRAESVRRFQDRRRAKDAVTLRWEAGGNRCEGCQRRVDYMERHHPFSSAGHLLADRWSSTPELMVALCCARSYGFTRGGCHEDITNERDLNLKVRMQWVAIVRLSRKYGIPAPEGHDAPQTVRMMVDALDRQMEQT